jgi:hypothetical protein
MCQTDRGEPVVSEQQATSRAEPRYMFGPLERPGVLLGLRGSQVAILALSLTLAIGVMNWVDPPGNVGIAAAIALAAAVTCFVPVAGRTVEEWTPVALRYAWQRGRGRHRWGSATPGLGHDSAGEATADLPECLAGLQILAAPVPAGGEIGVLWDRRADTYTALLALSGGAFTLLGTGEKHRRLAAWEDVLRGFGGEASPVHRIQWLERTAPDDGDALGRDLRQRRVVPIDSPIFRSYLEVLDGAGPASTQHEALLAVQITPRRAGRSMRQPGRSKSEAACAVLVDQVRRVDARLSSAGLRVLQGGLSPRMVARALRVAVEPQARTAMARRALHHPDAAGAAPASAWPLSTEANWRTFRTDAAVHATYWIAEWPRTDVGPDFLGPLLLATNVTRTVSVTMEPVDAAQAIRDVEHARTSEHAEGQLRDAKGFLTSHRRSREQQNLERRAAELQEGYADFRFAGYVTVTAATDEELEEACAEVRLAAQQSNLEIRRLAGEQDLAFTYTLPLGRGLR